MDVEQKLTELVDNLRLRGNDSYKFFEKIRVDMSEPTLRGDAIKRLSSSFAITQYGNFTSKEEKLLADIIEHLI